MACMMADGVGNATLDVGFQENTAARLAGVAGIEPANAGTKNRCLTTWLHPSRARSYNGDLANVKAEFALLFDCGTPLGKIGFHLPHQRVAQAVTQHRDTGRAKA